MIKNLQVLIDKKIKLNKSEIHTLVKQLRDELRFTLIDLPINFVNQETILNINTEYLKHNYTTDIITFNYSGDIENLEGEIFISYLDAVENSKKFKVSIESELARLVIHGILHLVGYDDMNASDKRKMKRLENNLVNKFANIVKTKVKIDDC